MTACPPWFSLMSTPLQLCPSVCIAHHLVPTAPRQWPQQGNVLARRIRPIATATSPCQVGSLPNVMLPPARSLLQRRHGCCELCAGRCWLRGTSRSFRSRHSVAVSLDMTFCNTRVSRRGPLLSRSRGHFERPLCTRSTVSSLSLAVLGRTGLTCCLDYGERLAHRAVLHA